MEINPFVSFLDVAVCYSATQFVIEFPSNQFEDGLLKLISRFNSSFKVIFIPLINSVGKMDGRKNFQGFFRNF